MGLFDRLFGKKKEVVEKEAQTPVSVEATELDHKETLTEQAASEKSPEHSEVISVSQSDLELSDEEIQVTEGEVSEDSNIHHAPASPHPAGQSEAVVSAQPDLELSDEVAQVTEDKVSEDSDPHRTPASPHPAGQSEAVVSAQPDLELSDEVAQITENEVSEDSDPHHAPASPHPAGQSEAVVSAQSDLELSDEEVQVTEDKVSEDSATHPAPASPHPAGQSGAVVSPQLDRELSDEVAQITENEVSEDSDTDHAPVSPHPAGQSEAVVSAQSDLELSDEVAQISEDKDSEDSDTRRTPASPHPAGQSEAVVPPQSDRELSDEVAQITENEISEDSDPHHAPVSPHPAGQSEAVVSAQPDLELSDEVAQLSGGEVSEDSNDGNSSVSVEDNHFSALMADYYAKKAAAKAAAERGETIRFEEMQTRPAQASSVEPLSPSLSQPEPVVETTQDKYNRTLKKTRTGFGAKLNAFLANFRRVDEEFFEELEELLILSDVGVTVATKLTEELRYEAKLEKAKKPEDLRRVIIEKLVDIYEKDGFDREAVNFQEGLTVMLFVGVNGVGKTTSIGKLAHQYKQAGKSVMLVAADTFRAGAVAQLVEWGRRVGVPVVTGPEKADPASVVFDGMEKAVAEGVDILLIDTAGRLQNKDNLMAELEKIGRIIKRVLPEAPHETLLALDASTGQNALSQAKEFSKITPLTGLVLTKLDGTARGGVVLAIREELDIPVKFIGFGEKIDDIGAFRSEEFMRGLLEGLV